MRKYEDTEISVWSTANLSPHAVMEILGLNEAQQERFLKATTFARRAVDGAEDLPHELTKEGST